MNEADSAELRRTERRALLAGSAVLALTAVHHVYGAIRYHTPERYHAAAIGVVALIVMYRALSNSRERAGRGAEKAWWVFWGVNATIAVLLFGVFEGLYNHLVKVALYYGGASMGLMRTLYPAPMYEMPNDAFFEVTGVLQALPAAVAAYHLIKLLSARRRRVHRVGVQA